MTTATEDPLERHLRGYREQIQKAIERGGLPTQAEVDAAETALTKAYDLVEALAVRVTEIAGIENVRDAPPYTVTLEQIGLVAALASNLLDLGLDQLRDRAEQLRDAVGPLDTVRRNQQNKAA